MRCLALSLLSLLLLATGGIATEPQAAPAALAYPDLSPADNARLAWWLEARYGMFLHWGVASIKGVDLSWGRKGSKPLDITGDPAGYVEDPTYDQLYRTWNPDQFDAKAWVAVAKAAGMKYLVLTAKHHDGFCLWDSKLTDYSIMHTPCKRDVVKEFTAACREAGLRVGLYYSPRDWHHPQYGIGDNRAYVDYMNGQLTELLTNYGTIDVLWFDSYGKGDLAKFWRIDETWQLIKKLQPQAIINNRLTVLGGYNRQPKPYWGDFNTPEQRIGGMATDRAWESCMTLVAGQWGYRPNGAMYDRATLIRAIVSCASGDGNLLLNTGPMPDGRIEPRQADLLKEGGDWLATYGHTVYGTRGGPWQNARWGGCTRAGNRVWLHVLDWTGHEHLRLQPIPSRITGWKVLTGGTVTLTQSPQGVDIQAPEPAFRKEPDTIIELTLDAPVAGVVKGPSLRSLFDDGFYGELLSAQATVTASSSGRGDQPARYASLVAVPALEKGSAVATDERSDSWIQVDLGQVRTVKGIAWQPHRAREKRFVGMTIAVSADGQAWTTVSTCRVAEDQQDVPVTATVAGAEVPGVAARYVRFTGVQPNSGLALRRVAVYGQ